MFGDGGGTYGGEEVPSLWRAAARTGGRPVHRRISYFRPANSSFWTLKTADVPVEAGTRPLDCGTLELVADVNKAEALVGRAPAI